MDERVNLNELERKRFASLVSSKNSIHEHPDEYRELKELVLSIVSDRIDPSAYHPAALRLAGLLREMSLNSPESVFSYFYRDIDPQQGGKLRYFRAACCDLFDQMEQVDRFRIGKRRMRRVK